MKRSRLLLVFYLALAIVMLVSIVACAKPAEAPAPAAPAAPAPKAPIVIRMPTSVPAGAAITDLRIEAAERFNARVGDRYEMTVYPGGSMGTLEETFDMCRTGGTEMTEWPAEYVAGNHPSFMAISLPLAINGFAQNQAFIDGLDETWTGKIVQDEFNQKTVALTVSDLHTYCGTMPVKTMADWKGKLVWVANPGEADGIAALGATPVSITFWDGYPALQKGTIDSGMTSEGTVFLFKWYDIIKHITLACMYGTMIHTTVNLDFYNSMPADVQQVLLEEYQWYKDQWEVARGQEIEEALAFLPTVGVEIYTLPDDERAKWREAVQPVYDSFYELVGADAAKAVQAALNKAAAVK